MPTPTPGGLYCYVDNGNPGNMNVSNFVMVGNNKWNEIWFLFAGVNSLGENRIYAVNQGGQLLSYSATNPLSNEVIVGADGWGNGNFTPLFAGVNLLGENRIYAVSAEGFLGLSGGQLLSYSDNGKPGNVGHPVIVSGDYEWFSWPAGGMLLFAGANSLGQNRIRAAPLNGQLQSFTDNGKPGNIINPVMVGDSEWFGFGTLCARRQRSWSEPHLPCLRFDSLYSVILTGRARHIDTSSRYRLALISSFITALVYSRQWDGKVWDRQIPEARAPYEKALPLARQQPEREFLARRFRFSFNCWAAFVAIYMR